MCTCINNHYIRIQLYTYVLCTHNNYNDYTCTVIMQHVQCVHYVTYGIPDL